MVTTVDIMKRTLFGQIQRIADATTGSRRCSDRRCWTRRLHLLWWSAKLSLHPTAGLHLVARRRCIRISVVHVGHRRGRLLTSVVRIGPSSRLILFVGRTGLRIVIVMSGGVNGGRRRLIRTHSSDTTWLIINRENEMKTTSVVVCASPCWLP